MDDDVGFDPNTYEGSPNVEVTHGYLVIAASFCLFFIISYVAVLLGPPKNIKGDTWRWRNTFVSWLHADLVAIGVIYCLVFVPEGFSNLIISCTFPTYGLVAFSLGYFLYDLADILYQGKLLSNWEVCLHHITVIISFWYAVYYRVNVSYTVIALLTEVNSVFLHARKLMQFDSWPFEHWLYRFVIWMNFFTFVTCRIYAIVYVGLGLYWYWDDITVVFRSFLVVTMVIMYLINPVLLWRLFKNDVLRVYGCGMGHKPGQNGCLKKPKASSRNHVMNGYSLNHAS